MHRHWSVKPTVICMSVIASHGSVADAMSTGTPPGRHPHNSPGAME